MKRIILSVFISYFFTTAGWGYKSLIDNSPFLPENYKKRTVQKQTGPQKNETLESQIEFKGIGSNKEGETIYLIYNKAANRSQWLKIGEGEILNLTRFDESDYRLYGKFNGEEESIGMKERSSSPAPAKRPGSTPPTQTRPSSVTKNSSTNPSTSSPQRRVVTPRRIIRPRTRTVTPANSSSK